MKLNFQRIQKNPTTLLLFQQECLVQNQRIDFTFHTLYPKKDFINVIRFTFIGASLCTSSSCIKLHNVFLFVFYSNALNYQRALNRAARYRYTKRDITYLKKQVQGCWPLKRAGCSSPILSSAEMS